MKGEGVFFWKTECFGNEEKAPWTCVVEESLIHFGIEAVQRDYRYSSPESRQNLFLSMTLSRSLTNVQSTLPPPGRAGCTRNRILLLFPTFHLSRSFPLPILLQ